MSRALAFVCALAAGTLVGLQAPANALLAHRVSDLGAALISLAVSVCIIAALLLVLGHPGRLGGLAPFRAEYLVGGLGGAAVVGIGIVAVRPLGAGGVTAVLVAGQLLVAVLADRLGWFGLHHVGLSAGRWAGILLVIGGTVLLTRA